MTTFYTLPVEEALAWIRAWTDQTWPISLQEAFAIRDSLGWRPSPKEPRYFTTKLSTSGKEDGVISKSNEYGIKGLHFNLSSIYSFDDDNQINQASHAAYLQYVTTLTKLWGPGASSKIDGVSQVRWILPSKVAVSIFGMNGLVSIDIDSPWLTQITEEYDRIVPPNA